MPTVTRVEIHTLGRHTYARVHLDFPGIDGPVVLDGYKVRTSAIDGRVTVYAPTMNVSGDNLRIVYVPDALYEQIRTAVVAELESAR
jgi:hypothetical protein